MVEHFPKILASEEKALPDNNCVEWNHVSVTLTLKLSTRAPKVKDETGKVSWIEKLVWDTLTKKVPEFLEALTSNSVQTGISHALLGN